MITDLIAFFVVVTDLFVFVFQLLSHVRLFVTLWIAAHQVLHYLLEFTQSHVHWVNNAIQPSYPLKGALRRRPPFSCLDLSQHQYLFLLELFFVVHVFLEDCLFHQCWGFFPWDLEATNLKEGHSDSLLQGLTNLFLQSSLFIEAGTKILEYTASRACTGLTPNQ